MDKLLKILSQNSSFSNKELAMMLGEPEDYVAAQIKEYEQAGIIRGYRAIVDWNKTEDTDVRAMIELKVTPRKETGFDEIAAQILEFEEVTSMYLMAGSFDFAVFIKGRTMQDIASFVARKISCVDGVVATATHFMLQTYKVGGMNLLDFDEEDGRSLVL